MQVHRADALFQCLAAPCVCLSTSTYSTLSASSPYSFGKKYKKVRSCQTSRWSCFICLSHSVILRWCHYFHPTHTLYIGMLFPTVFVVFVLILPDVDLMLFVTFIASCKTFSINLVCASSRAGWELDPGGL